MAKGTRVSRTQILGFRRRTSHLDERLPLSAASLRRASWAGLQDSCPRAAIVSLHARIRGVTADVLDHPALCQVWGPRYSAFVVASRDVAAFTRGRMPSNSRGRDRAEDAAARLAKLLRGRRMPFGQAGRSLGMPPNSLRYATTTGSLRIDWDGARQPDIWHVPAPGVEPPRARRELLARFLHVFGPSSAESFARWAGISDTDARTTVAAAARMLVDVETPIGQSLLLAADVDALRSAAPAAESVRLLPSGDTYFLCWGNDRRLLVEDSRRRAQLWTSRVWPGAVLMGEEIVGTWRRAADKVVIHPWLRLAKRQRAAIEAEARTLPIPLQTAASLTVLWR